MAYTVVHVAPLSALRTMELGVQPSMTLPSVLSAAPIKPPAPAAVALVHCGTAVGDTVGDGVSVSRAVGVTEAERVPLLVGDGVLAPEIDGEAFSLSDAVGDAAEARLARAVARAGGGVLAALVAEVDVVRLAVALARVRRHAVVAVGGGGGAPLPPAPLPPLPGAPQTLILPSAFCAAKACVVEKT